MITTEDNIIYLLNDFADDLIVDATVLKGTIDSPEVEFDEAKRKALISKYSKIISGLNKQHGSH